jgi:hypothetical protein
MMFLIFWGRLLGVALVKVGDDIGGVVDVRGWVPHFVMVIESYPLYSILKVVSMIVGINDFFNFLFLSLSTMTGRRGGYMWPGIG